MAFINFANFFVAEKMGNTQLKHDCLMLIVLCAVGAVLNYLRLPKDER